MTDRFEWTCPRCGLKLTSGRSFDLVTDCPVCQRKELLDHVAAGGETRFPVNLSRAERSYLDGRRLAHKAPKP